MHTRIKIECPYCKKTTSHVLRKVEFFSQRIVVNCDSEQGGCDEHYVVLYRVDLKHEVYPIGEGSHE